MSGARIANDEAGIILALRTGHLRDAETVLTAMGGALYAFLHGYESLARIIDAMPQDAHLDSEVFLGAYALLLLKQGRARRAKALLDGEQIRFSKTYLFDLCELLVAIHLGEDLPDDQVNRWTKLEGRLPAGQPLCDGIYYNSMLVIMVRLNRTAQARNMGQLALESYALAAQPYLLFFIHLHLADLAIVEGELKTARRHVRTAERFHAESGRSYGNEPELVEIIWLSIDFEMGKLEHIPQRAARIRQALVRGDSWAEIFIQICRIGTMSTYFLQGRQAAMRFLDDSQSGFHRRHGAFSNTLDVIGANINLLEGQLDLAQQGLLAARQQGLFSLIGTIVCENVQGKIDPARTTEPAGSASTSLRQNVMAELIRAANAQSQKQAAALRHHVESAMRLAVREGLVAVFLEHREVVAKVSRKLATGAFARGHLQLARMARQINKRVLASYIVPKPLLELGITTQQMRVLTALRSGAPNKQIARNLGLSEATVKFHIHNMFDTLKVSKRGQLIAIIEQYDEMV